jgi:hypothetical protein
MSSANMSPYVGGRGSILRYTCVETRAPLGEALPKPVRVIYTLSCTLTDVRRQRDLLNRLAPHTPPSVPSRSLADSYTFGRSRDTERWLPLGCPLWVRTVRRNAGVCGRSQTAQRATRATGVASSRRARSTETLV